MSKKHGRQIQIIFVLVTFQTETNFYEVLQSHVYMVIKLKKIYNKKRDFCFWMRYLCVEGKDRDWFGFMRDDKCMSCRNNK